VWVWLSREPEHGRNSKGAVKKKNICILAADREADEETRFCGLLQNVMKKHIALYSRNEVPRMLQMTPLSVTHINHPKALDATDVGHTVKNTSHN
jgi:hypothetical protein